MNYSDLDLEAMVNEYSTGLIKYCYSILGDYYSSEDVVQDTFVRVLSARKNIKDLDNIKTYLYKISYNLCVDYLRRRKRGILLEEKYKRYTREKLTSDGPYTYLSETTLLAFGSLKPADRALVYGIAVEGRSFKEMGKILGKNESALRKRYQRAKEKMKDYYKKGEKSNG